MIFDEYYVEYYDDIPTITCTQCKREYVDDEDGDIIRSREGIFCSFQCYENFLKESSMPGLHPDTKSIVIRRR